jgi:hypothetical protein
MTSVIAAFWSKYSENIRSRRLGTPRVWLTARPFATWTRHWLINRTVGGRWGISNWVNRGRQIR